MLRVSHAVHVVVLRADALGCLTSVRREGKTAVATTLNLSIMELELRMMRYLWSRLAMSQQQLAARLEGVQARDRCHPSQFHLCLISFDNWRSGHDVIILLAQRRPCR